MCCSDISSSSFFLLSSFFFSFFNFPQEHLDGTDSCTFELDKLLSHLIPKVYSLIYWVLEMCSSILTWSQASSQNHLGMLCACCSRIQTHTHSPASLPRVALWHHCQVHLPSFFIRGITRAPDSISVQHSARGEKIKVPIWIRCSLGILLFKNRA